MNKILVNEPSSDIRQLARQALKGYWKVAAVTFLLYQIVLQVPDLIIRSLIPSAITSGAMDLYWIFVGAPLALGITMVFMNIFRRKPTAPMDIFNGFEYLMKAVFLQLVTYIFTVLWALLFIIPGIVAAYRYSLAFYILADDPTKGVFQCINESKYLMMGNKAKAFCLDLSFFGWSLLCSIPAVVFTMFFAAQYDYTLFTSGGTYFDMVLSLQSQPMYNLGSLILGLTYCFLTPYVSVASVCLYDMINGNLTVRRVPAGGGVNSQPPAGGWNGQGFGNGQDVQDVQDVTYRTVTPKEETSETEPAGPAEGEERSGSVSLKKEADRESDNQ